MQTSAASTTRRSGATPHASRCFRLSSSPSMSDDARAPLTTSPVIDASDGLGGCGAGSRGLSSCSSSHACTFCVTAPARSDARLTSFAPYTTDCSTSWSSDAQRRKTTGSPRTASGRFSSRSAYTIQLSCSAQCTFDSHTRSTNRSSTEPSSESAGSHRIMCASCGRYASRPSIARSSRSIAASRSHSTRKCSGSSRHSHARNRSRSGLPSSVAARPPRSANKFGEASGRAVAAVRRGRCSERAEAVAASATAQTTSTCHLIVAAVAEIASHDARTRLHAMPAAPRAACMPLSENPTYARRALSGVLRRPFVASFHPREPAPTKVRGCGARRECPRPPSAPRARARCGAATAAARGAARGGGRRGDGGVGARLHQRGARPPPPTPRARADAARRRRRLIALAHRGRRAQRARARAIGRGSGGPRVRGARVPSAALACPAARRRF